MNWRIHELCLAIPEMDPAAYEKLVSSIKKVGVISPIVVHEGAIVDGRHRWRACKDLGVECPHVQWDQKGSLVDFVAAANIERRHLTDGQLAAVAVNLLPFYEAEAKERQREHGGTAPGRCGDTSRNPARSDGGKSAVRAAAAVGAKPRSVESAKRVKKEDPQLFDRIVAGEITPTAAERLLKERERTESDDGAAPSPEVPCVNAPFRGAIAIHECLMNEAPVKRQSVDLVVARTDVPRLAALTVFAGAVLKPGGVCLLFMSCAQEPESRCADLMAMVTKLIERCTPIDGVVCDAMAVDDTYVDAARKRGRNAIAIRPAKRQATQDSGGTGGCYA